MDVSLVGKKILITGGTSALGFQFVKKAREAGAQVFFTLHSDNSKARELSAVGAEAFQVNLASSSDIHELSHHLYSKVDRLDGLIHNAAVLKDHTIQNLSETEWDEVLNVDLKSVYLLTKELLALLQKKERSKILNVISQAGLHGGFGQANYSAAKGGLIAFTKSLAEELGPTKVLVNGLNPGFMNSKMTRGSADIIERNRERSLLKEISDPEEVADFMVYLMSDRFKRVSGQIFHYESRNV